MSSKKKKIVFNPVGIVRNNVLKRREIPLGGVDSEIFIYPEYRPALKGLNCYSHIWVISHLHKSRTDVLQARPRKVRRNGKLKGVFAIHSPDRPAPVGLSKVELISCKNGVLKVKNLDFINGTPVLDIKSASDGNE
ncbi:MAG: tRNA (N6-threonylcarbamoyladenosine(37)-N6)-methyltransferase TrmO [Elusimicrobia bacterium CG_4_10_14_3_um_filter_49_12_50_7]|nr:MAG: tRNA (N6-threonylcarbamoyladenosine(37)-N6)-methyltransferase TrmO [Elusimicrobia bacterium CG03_land_8_20_14_0_80_50_18]PIX16235.1 MAG: tRNA (N6-threonylcarbamoyladenosine(37)-N6)-methyltransferase TrmO [Elusimicrobia bacterium CG_4_8_14_3_um_filter_50_9]PIY17887.1 MAG: tRNA (N6-threonylcarbamoyladenosine(37)-N6)-methyltransferase TrmO [Elusimicrobia bacterium CG_4_10_14_3_um_filter_49_12_50_7]